MKWPLEVLLPEIKKAFQFREVRRKIVFLPYVKLKKFGVVGKTIMYFGRGQAIALQLKFECSAAHDIILMEQLMYCSKSCQILECFQGEI
jgi:hypothetical protein